MQNKFKLRRQTILIVLIFALFSGFSIHMNVLAQEVTGNQEFRWISVGSLWNWFSNAGAEVEYGRRGRTCCQETDQADQLYWEAEYSYPDRCVSKSMWIGTTDYDDPISGEFYSYKVIPAGPRYANNITNFMPVSLDPYNTGADHDGIYSVGRFVHPTVMVDDIPATNLDDYDLIDYIDPELPADRVVVNKLHSNMGVTVTRKIYAFSHQDHENYYIYEYTFKNTGIYDPEDPLVAPHQKTLTGFIPMFHYRYAPGHDGAMKGWGIASTRWGTSTLNQVVWDDPTTDEVDLVRATYAWYHPHSSSTLGLEGDWGQPNGDAPSPLGAPCFLGDVVLHADKSAADKSDDLNQPYSAPWIGSDALILSLTDSYEIEDMTTKYLHMISGIPNPTHADLIGMNRFGDEVMEGIGGNSTSLGFGPYTLAPGDSVNIVLSEAVAGLKRKMALEVGYNWYAWHSGTGTPTLLMPDESETTDQDAYKKAWVWTAEDSLFAAFRHAKEMWEGGLYNGIQEPPRPPEQFIVTSGSDKITLDWQMPTDVDLSNLSGFYISRAEGRADTLYEVIHTTDATARTWDDTSPVRGRDYYYYIQSFSNDDVPLVSNKFWTMTNTAARLKKPPKAALDSIRVIPNPWDIRSRELQFGSESGLEDRIAFFGLPAKCTIKIFTERGDLVKIIEHANGSADDYWHQETESRQIVVSGLYIAYFETPDGKSAFRKFIIIR
jgi:hypothetical protein